MIVELLPKITRRDGSLPSSWRELREKVMSFPVAQMGAGLRRLWNAPSKRGLSQAQIDAVIAWKLVE